ncbi:hypothetical protein [Bifidobacterium leontopitheci]|uniref:Uncharacterized protein n=1 Tax=Bifidobacterium leontopitheci TaxID=2650774 RepID=A0A6I1GBN4_9BIFI|nr:hypothetical protein [Bifidobacterium leontopitheci]KAB7788985.1 hypothetical protein F7D09_2060 [Bifidobacterium leontopitheci]
MPSAKRYNLVISREPDDQARERLLDSVIEPLRRRIERQIEATAGSSGAAGAEGSGKPVADKPAADESYTMFSTGNLALTHDERVHMQEEVRAVWRHYEALSQGRDPKDYAENVVYEWSVLPDDVHE